MRDPVVFQIGVSLNVYPGRRGGVKRNGAEMRILSKAVVKLPPIHY